MNNLLVFVIFLYAAAILGCLIANLVVGLDIRTSSKIASQESTRAADAGTRAADASQRAATASETLVDGLDDIKTNLRKVYEWIITHDHLL